MTITDTMTDILDHACPNGGVRQDGWNTYVIETHCLAWKITAKKIAGEWHILRADTEPC